MLLEVALRKFLLSCSDITELLGEGDNARIYPVAMPQAPVLPTMTYQRISTDRDFATTGPTGLATARIQCDVWAPTSGGVSGYWNSKKIADAVRRLTNGYRGLMGEGGVNVQLCVFEGDRDLYEDGVKLYRVNFSLLISHHEQEAA